ncbi:serine carboxypeptidase S28-domain-containing protein [Annulohypoxylon maeteangense]|uniref:serine carboxypeptidase S28-domain-containing protein n=1 Tax=Annulohypoxylon maeteangense TaxID=1927788 RepID=UPI0020085A61|nr:serine carboxypeptidase S28-domain-containing protein [Annulohypoxylon maeteangense]KAI0886394.1 serine carboxypeptidase S28-domain-containing protein [Annulohypoxylon maeteangense]
MKSITAVVQLLLASGASASFMRHTAGMQIGPIDEDTFLVASNGTAGWGTFEQLLDHSNPDLGTFSQRYWYGAQYWKGPGSPVILVNPGEQAADGFNITYTTNQRLTGLFAEKLGAAVVVLEHRYWGESSPFDSLTVANLKYLTLENSIKDNTYFANNFDTPFDTTGKSSAKDAPWIFTGGSYPGALAGWIAAKDPGTFWAYYGTSGVVEAIGDFWQYFVPVQEATPQNCSTDLNAVIDYVDSVLLHGSPKEKTQLKAKFQLTNLEDADFAAALENGPWTWQSGQFYSSTSLGYNPYYRFCDYIENQFPNTTNAVPGPEGVGLAKALDGYAKWFLTIELPGLCEGYGYFDGKYNTDCLQSLNASNPIYHDLSPSNAGNRQWNWMLCNEPFEYWQDGAPKDQPTLVSRLVNKAYWRSQCPLWFPEPEYGIAQGKSAEDVNTYTGGWLETNTTRLMMANGQWDPWRDATLSSKFRPDGPKESTTEFPIRVVEHGTHCSDLYGQNWAVNPGVKAVADAQVANMATWVQEFYDQKK